ncbi:MAG TPA: DNA-3-methyladenine glycosylase [Bryobacteraceae bacterium]|nr:DNA-3-methyladenine glycosylase [Bryobacteraceae bacterium]
MQKALDHLKAADPVLRRLIEQVGPYGIEFLDPGFEALVKSIVLQQLSGKVASVIYARLVAASGGALSPQAVLKMRTPKLRSTGLSQRKIEYIRDVARRIVKGQLDLAALTVRGDEEVLAELTAIRGIGPWTVHMFLIFALRRLDVMPSGDLGIRAAVRKVYGLEEMPSPAEVDRMSERWRPYCTVASWYLWRSLEDKAGL